MAMYYYLILVLFVVLYFLIVFLMKKITNKKLTNFIFISIIFCCYIALVVKVYFDVGFNDWNFQNTLPIANVSPFMFFTVLLYYVLPNKIKKISFNFNKFIVARNVFCSNFGLCAKNCYWL